MTSKLEFSELLMEAGSEGMPILPLLISLARNIANLSRIGGPEKLVVPSADGRDLHLSLVNVLNEINRLRLSSYEDRANLKHGQAHVARKGQRFDVNAWLRSSTILLKMAQAAAIAKPKDQLDIVSRYLMRPGRWHDKMGLGEEQVKAWRKKDSAAKLIFKPDFAMRLTALAVPADLDRQSPSDQIAYLKGLGLKAKALFEPLTDNLIPAESLWLLFDLSLHSDMELRRMLKELETYRQETLEDRLIGLAKSLVPALAEIEDLLPDLSWPFAQFDTSDLEHVAVARAIGTPSVAHSFSLSKLILPVAGARENPPSVEHGENLQILESNETADKPAKWLPRRLL
jgi:hypothetical protein